MILNVRIAIRLKRIDGARMNAFEQENLDFVLLERSLAQVSFEPLPDGCGLERNGLRLRNGRAVPE